VRQHSISGRTTEPHILFFGGRVLGVVGTFTDLNTPTLVLYGYAGRGAPRCV
jgi:hypothetical protein